MSDDPIDLIRRLPQLYYATEKAAHAGQYLDSAYTRGLRAACAEAYDELCEHLNGFDLELEKLRQAVAALDTLRDSPAERARIDTACTALSCLGPTRTGDLYNRRSDDMLELLHKAGTMAAAEMGATRVLVDLLHTKGGTT